MAQSPKSPGHRERTVLLKRFGATLAWPQALDTARNWGQSSLQLNQINQNALLNSLRRAHLWERLVSQLFLSSQDLWSFSSLVSACSSWSRSVHFLELMRWLQHEPNVVCTTAASTRAPWRCALGLFRVVQPNEVSISSTQSACEKGSQWVLAIHLLDGMAVDGLRANVVAYNVAVQGYVKATIWPRAVLAAHHPKADLATANTAVACLRWTQALQLMMQPDLVTYSAMLSTSRWDVARQLFAQLPMQHLEANAFAPVATATACVDAKVWRAALDLARVGPVAAGVRLRAWEVVAMWPMALNLSLNLVAGTSALSMAPWRSALTLLAGLKAQSCVDAVAYTAVAPRLARRLLQDMWAETLEPNLILLAAAATPCAPDLLSLLDQLDRGALGLVGKGC